MTSKSKKMAVLAVLQEQDSDISLPQLLELLTPVFSERTVRRWLVEMEHSGLITKTGKKRSTRYRLSPSTRLDTDKHLTFTKPSVDAIRYVRQPLFERNPATYNPKWFLAYEPNKTFYLNEDLRNKLLHAGEKSKDHLPAGTYARKIYNRLLIDLSYNSSRLEGNTYSLLDTQRLILEGTGAPGKLTEDKIMILNHKEAIAYLVNNSHQLQINYNTICTLHYLLSDGLIPTQYAGKIRDYGVRISGSTYVPWENPEKLNKQLCAIIEKASLIENPFEQSLFLLAHVSYLQAFADVNKRTSRLSANIPLIKNNLVPLSFNDVNKEDYQSAVISVYELNDIHALIELYVHSYLYTCKLYEVTLEVVSFDEIRVRYRQQRRKIISHIITHGLTTQEMQAYIHDQAASQIEKKDQAAFIEDIKEDLREINPDRIVGLGVTVQQLNAWLKKQ